MAGDYLYDPDAGTVQELVAEGVTVEFDVREALNNPVIQGAIIVELRKQGYAVGFLTRGERT